MREQILDMLQKEFFFVFTDEFISKNKNYFDFLMKDNLSFLLYAIATWIAFGFFLFTVYVTAGAS